MPSDDRADARRPALRRRWRGILTALHRPVGVQIGRSIPRPAHRRIRMAMLVIGRSFLRIQQATDFAGERWLARMADDARRSCAGAESALAISARTRPGRADMTTTRSPRKTASEMLCVMSMMVLRLRLPDALQLEVHALARQGIERAERLVHQQDLRIARQRTADAGALLHAAGQLIRIAMRRNRRARSSRAAHRYGDPPRRDAAHAQRQAHVLAHA